MVTDSLNVNCTVRYLDDANVCTSYTTVCTSIDEGPGFVSMMLAQGVGKVGVGLMGLVCSMFGDKISTSLVECEHVKAKIGKALRADGSPRMWKKLPPARGQKGFLS